MLPRVLHLDKCMEAPCTTAHFSQCHCCRVEALKPDVFREGQQRGALHGILTPKEQRFCAELVHLSRSAAAASKQ